MINAGAVLYFIAGFVAGAVLWAGLYMVFETLCQIDWKKDDK